MVEVFSRIEGSQIRMSMNDRRDGRSRRMIAMNGVEGGGV